MGRKRKGKVQGDLDFSSIIRQHVRLLPPELAREEELNTLFEAAVNYTLKTPQQRDENRKNKARWLAELDRSSRDLDGEIYSEMDATIKAVETLLPLRTGGLRIWNGRNLGMHRAAVDTTKWRGAKQMEDVYKNGWDCTEVEELLRLYHRQGSSLRSA